MSIRTHDERLSQLAVFGADDGSSLLAQIAAATSTPDIRLHEYHDATSARAPSVDDTWNDWSQRNEVKRD